ncbi:MAG: LysM peptidoglycan-binding domain-containing M23 family metallopeptidase [Candidatus Omnitrophota bacterium]
MFFRSLIIIFLLGLSACATVEQPPAPSSPNQAQLASIEHVVAKGETLWRISKIYNAELEDIVRINGLSDSSLIAYGQKIIIPNAKRANTAVYDNDFIWPSKGKVIVTFRQKDNGVSNKGIDILTEPNQDVLASRTGKVIFLGELPGYGNTIIIDHRDGFSSLYCGNSSVGVKIGDEVQQGMVVAKTGQTPRKDSGSLHFEIRKKHKPQNPLYYLN